jgi:Tol biopolymer transport system component/DNA-binding winged helix-turn-helix (wHTH) protein
MADAAERNSEHFRFGPFALDRNRRELRRGAAVVPLTDKAFDLLATLVRRAGRTVTKSELMAALWPDTRVEESNLTQTMFLLRKALGEDSAEGGFIRTARGQGYTFVVPTTALQESQEAPNAKPRAWWKYAAASGGIVVLAGLAVEYFRDPAPEASLVRSTTFHPEKARYTDGMLALSPDGRRIAFALTPENSPSQLWIRPLDGETAHPLAGTEGASHEFWSPDSRWIGFFAGGKLKKMDTQGGPPIELADAPVPLGGSWSSKGVILFSPTYDSLQKVSSSGGAVSPATDPAVGNSQCCPWFLPDGEHYLFATNAHAGSGSQPSLRVGSLNFMQSKLIGEGTAVYAQGRLLYLRDNTLVAQPFDVKALRMTGEPQAIVEPVGHYRGPFQEGYFTVSSAGSLAYLAPAPPGVGKQLTWFDRTGKALATIGSPRSFYDIELSPDRTRLAATIAEAGNVDVWTYDLARGSTTRFTFDPAGEGRAIWSPDGRSIVFNSNRKGHGDFYRKSADGAGSEELPYADDRVKYPVSWSRDGKFLIYLAGGGAQLSDLWVLPMATDRSGPELGAALKPRPFLQPNVGFGQFSPDGRWVAYQSAESQSFQIYVSSFTRPNEKHQVSPKGGTRPRWRQDGKEIFYLTPEGQLMAAEVRIRADTIEVGAVSELFGGIELGAGYYYDVTADGQRILAVMRNRTSPVPITLVQNWASALKR